ncbi:MAG: PD40 domain-containing protein [Armatimonadetes bacterium]|nr:PD40 domain-containing protein [Armatimonadota bacterium]
MRGTLFLACILASAANATPIYRASQPGLSPDGSTVVFSWQNDLWLCSTNGGEARRITVHPAIDSSPRFTPDGKQIIFSSTRYGNSDLFSIAPDGTGLKRLSYDSATEVPYSITPDGKYVIGHTAAWGRINMFAMPVSGGDLIRLTGHPLELTFYGSVSPDGKKVAYNLNGSPGAWRNPLKNGTDTSEIFVGDFGTPISNNKNVTKNDDNDLFPMFGKDGLIYFVSNRSGKPNLWCMDANGQKPRQLTQHDGGTLRWPSMAANGRSIVYEYDSQLKIYDIASGKSSTVEAQVPEDEILNPVFDLSLNSGVTEVAVSPDGKRSVIAVRGDIFLIPERGGTTRKLTSSPALDLNPVWLDNKTVLFSTGRNGKREFMTVDINGVEKPYMSGNDDLVFATISPDRNWIAFNKGDGEIALKSLSGATSRTLVKGGFISALQGEQIFNWSPDSKWITYADRTERGSNVYIVEVSSGNRTLVARLAGEATSPRFLPNGKGIYYTSSEFSDSDIMIVDLVPSELSFTEDDLDGIDAEKSAAKPTNEVKIDPRKIDKRIRRLTNGNAVALGAAPNGRAIYANVDGQFSLVPVTGGPAAPVAAVTGGVNSLTTGPTPDKYYAIAGGKLLALSTASNATAPVGFNAQSSINRKAEDLALFEEIWWAMSRFYYDPNHHNVGWAKIRNEYRALVPTVFDRQDFYALMNEMIEELNSSHLSISSPPAAPAQANDSTGFLGVEWNWAKLMTDGVYQVDSVLGGSPADNSYSLLQKGDWVTAVDGVAIGANRSFAEALRNKIGQRVRLTVKRGDQTMEIAIKPSSPGIASGLRYEEFIEQRRAEVERLSGGKCTYFHIQGMNAPSTERFFRDIRVYGEGKKGAIIDVRWNGGGNTANQVLVALRTEPWLWRKFRLQTGLTMTEEMFRGNVIEMPTVLMTNQFSASNAEILSEGYRQMKIGKVVGEATGGNVLTIGGQYGLWDGGGVQIPFIGIFTVNGESLEGIGRRTDVDVRYDPNAWIAGRDNQLERAVQELMKSVK